MYKKSILWITLLVSLVFTLASYAHDHTKKELKTNTDGRVVVWHNANQQWVEPEKFWLAYAKERGGLTWGQRTSYPPYNQVKEFDTVLIQLDNGHCLMEFFHSRWRRANDVRRWGTGFNLYSACPFVFE